MCNCSGNSIRSWQSYRHTQIKAQKCSERRNKQIHDRDSQKHQAVAGRAPTGKKRLSCSLREWQQWLSDGRGVCLLLYISTSVLLSIFARLTSHSSHQYLWPTVSQYLFRVGSLALFVSVSYYSERTGCGWQGSRRWYRLLRLESNLYLKWIHIWYWFLHNQSVSNKPV